MADHPHITPEMIAVAAEVFQRTASYTESAKAIGKSRVATMQALKRASDSNVRQHVYARTLDAVLTECVTAQREAVKVLRRDVKNGDPKIAHSASAQLNDTARAASTARTALAKLTGEHAPDRIAATLSAEVVVLPALETDGSPAPQGAMAAEPGSSE